MYLSRVFQKFFEKTRIERGDYSSSVHRRLWSLSPPDDNSIPYFREKVNIAKYTNFRNKNCANCLKTKIPPVAQVNGRVKRGGVLDPPVRFIEERDFISHENIEKDYINKEAASDALAFIHKLEEPYKEVFLLRHYADLPFQQIGALFGKTESWARVVYHRARIKIQEELQ